MQKINFQNLPSTTTPVNASNLNTMQSNIESDINSRASRITFSISSNSSKTLTFPDSGMATLFTGKGTLGEANNCTLIFTYGAGGTARYKTKNLENGAGHITFTIGNENTRQITIANSSTSSYSCSLIVLVGSASNITIS